MPRSQILTLLGVGLVATGYWLLSPGQAQPATPPAHSLTGVVNVPELFRDSQEMKTLDAEGRKRAENLKTNADKQTAALAAQEKDIREKFEPTTKAFKDRMRDLLTERIRFRVTMEEQRNDMLIEQQSRSEAFYAKIGKVVETLARDDGLDVVLFMSEPNLKSARNSEELLAMIGDRKVVYHSARADITAKVLERLDADFAAPKPQP